MINYYELLEVSKNASDEVIEKAYKVLAKRYHPDLQPSESKNKAEEKMKLINQAYDTLINETKREKYNQDLERYEARQNELKYKQNNITSNNASEVKPKAPQYTYATPNANNMTKEEYEKEKKRQEKFARNLEKEKRRRYLEAYDNYLRKLGYRVKTRWTFERVIAILLTIVVVLITFIVLWMIPYTRSMLVKLYEENFVVKLFVDMIRSIFEVLFNKKA